MGSRRGGPRGNGVNTLDGQVVPQAHPHCGDHRRRRAPDRPDSLRERPHGNPRLPPAGADRRRACRRGGWLAGGVSRRGECGRLTGRARTGSAGRECGGLTRRVSARRTDQSRAEVVQLVGAAGRGDQCAECRVGQRFALIAGRAGLGERGSENTQSPPRVLVRLARIGADEGTRTLTRCLQVRGLARTALSAASRVADRLSALSDSSRGDSF